ncbi:Protein DIA2 [Madurella mycetomatis]|uniref:Protein DIA2 n=1 Tax=Madurella mycetomatis TaxID=100816 RepID=A0A175VPE7_9PEZI|nr:Protein DIA2 [Madurella mycetomatis]
MGGLEVSRVPGGRHNQGGEMEAALDNGCKLMNGGLYSKAVAQVMSAISMCECNQAGGEKMRHGKDKSCNISQCAAAVQSRDPDALYQVARGPCSCGYIWQSCTRPLHIQAVDALAGCLGKAEQHISALSTALSIIRLDPASAVGYCRVAKIMRYLLKHSRSSDPAVDRSVALILRETGLASVDLLHGLINCFVKSGMYNTEQYRHSPNNQYHFILRRMADSLRIEDARSDPCKKLPVEVLRMIFSHLDSACIVRCLRVNKRWNQVVMRDSMLWTDFRLGRPQNPGRFFSRFLQKHQEITSFVIYETTDFVLTGTKLNNILHGLPRLKRLCLCSKSLLRQQPETFGLPGRPAANLTQLSLASLHSPAVVKQLVELTSDTLEVLDLIETGSGVDHTIGSALFQRLKKLRVTTVNTSKVAIRMELLVRATPNLEQFYLDGFKIYTSGFMALGETRDYWPYLRKIVVGRAVHCVQVQSPINDNVFPPLPSTMRSIEILSNDPTIANMALLTPADRTMTDHQPNFPLLEVFRCSASFPHHSLQRILEPAAKAGNLRILELATEPVGRQAVIPQPAKDWAFIRPDNIHTLGLQNFNWGSVQQASMPGYGFNGQPFIDWLECFPNLHTVAVYPGPYPNIEAFIMQLIQHPNVKAIHQDALRGVHWDEAVKMAKKLGVELHNIPRSTPSEWPMLED